MSCNIILSSFKDGTNNIIFLNQQLWHRMFTTTTKSSTFFLFSTILPFLAKQVIFHLYLNNYILNAHNRLFPFCNNETLFWLYIISPQSFDPVNGHLCNEILPLEQRKLTHPRINHLLPDKRTI